MCYIFFRLLLSFSLAVIEKMYPTLETLFYQTSKPLEILEKLSARCLKMSLGTITSACLMYYRKSILELVPPSSKKRQISAPIVWTNNGATTGCIVSVVKYWISYIVPVEHHAKFGEKLQLPTVPGCKKRSLR